MLILGLPGSLRRDSYNRRLLEAAARELPHYAKLNVYEGLPDIPPYSEDDPAPKPVAMLRDAIAAAEAVLLATPEYNGSVPGQLKNALDWASRPWPGNALRGKPAAVIGASTGLFGAMWAQAELRKVLTTIGAQVLDAELPVSQAHEAFDETGCLRDVKLRAALDAIVNRLLDAAEGGRLSRAG